MKPWQYVLRLCRGRSATQPGGGARRCYRPRLERLETRVAPAAHDTIATAIAFPFNGNPATQVSGNLLNPNQVDLYAVHLSAGDQVTADVGRQTLSSTIDALRIFNSTGQQLAFHENTDSSHVTALTFEALTAGDYYIGVSSNGDYNYNPNTSGSGVGGMTSGGYDLMVSVGSILIPESPSNFSQPTAQPLTGNTAVVQGTYAPSTMEYYSITANTTEVLTVAITPANPNAWMPQLTLYGASGQLLIQSAAGASPNEAAQLTQNLQLGTYYVAVSALGNGPTASQQYTLAVTFTSALAPFQPLPVGVGPQAVATGDFNHDGNLDFVTINPGSSPTSSSVSVMLGNGDGTFKPAVTYTVGSSPKAVVVADFNNDGNLDILTVNRDDTVSVFLGRGDGMFQQTAISSLLPTGTDPFSVAFGYFNQDHNLDLVIGNLNNPTAPKTADQNIEVLTGNGDGTFQLKASYLCGFSPADVAVGAFNRNNGNVDIIAVTALSTSTSTSTSYTTVVAELLGNGDGTFDIHPRFLSSQPGLPGASVVAVEDLNHDGNLDIVIPSNNSSRLDSVMVLLGKSDGTFDTGNFYPVGTSIGALALGYFHSGGNLDIVTTGGGRVSVLQRQADGTFLPAVTTPVGGGAYAMAPGDFNNDGNLDIVFTGINVSTDHTASLFLGRGDGSFLPADSTFSAGTTAAGLSPRAVAMGDFNNDGNLDIVTADANAVSVLLGTGNGNFSPPVSYPLGFQPSAVAVGDFNNDGNLDIVVANVDSISVLLGRGDGTFVTGMTYKLGYVPTAVAVADFNNDGNLDIVVTGSSTHSIASVLLGKGNGKFTRGTTWHMKDSPNAIAVGYFSNDGNRDIIITGAHNTASVFLGNGKGAFPLSKSYKLGPRPKPASDPAVAIAVGAFANGGPLIIATTDILDNMVTVLLGNGLGAFSVAGSYFLGNGSGPNAVAVANFNNKDGSLDIVTANSLNNTLSVLPVDSNGLFGTPVTLPAGGGEPTGVLVGDFNNDGSLDIATANAGNNTVSLYLNDGSGKFQAITAASGIAVQNVPYLQDLTGDGVPDSIILDSAGNILFRQGLPGAGYQFLPPVIINQGNPARDITVFKTPNGWAVAAVDDKGNSVSIYTWDSATGLLKLGDSIATGNGPVRIAAADLTGNGRDDLVVANALSDNITVALQAPSGQFNDVIQNLPIGVGPSGITFLNVAGQAGPDIVVSDQVSGDYTVLVNDGTGGGVPTFSQEYRYRAGSGLFGVAGDPNTGAQTVVSLLQTVGMVAGDFTKPGSNDLVTLNRGAQSFTLLPNLGQGNFANPEAYHTYSFPDTQPSQIVRFTLPGQTVQSIGVLMASQAQIWVYANKGNGCFAPPVISSAGNDPTGFSVACVNGQLALLVGNSFGDVLTLLYQGGGQFTPDTTNLQGTALQVGRLANGRQYAVVANQDLNQVSLYYRIGVTDQVGRRISVTTPSMTPLLAPGAVQIFHVKGDANPYMVVANSMSNDVLIYHYDTATRGFDFLEHYSVGDNPTSVTVAYLRNGVPDLLVANNGSNDVSVLIGSITGGVWTATAYQRLKSGGFGPIAVAVRPASGGNPVTLLMTNSNGTVTSVPEIGNSGFFQDIKPPQVSVGQRIPQSVPGSSPGQLFLVRGDGGISALAGGVFTTIFTPTAGKAVTTLGVTTSGEFGSFLIAGFGDGSVALLSDAGAVMASDATGLTDVSALQALQDGSSVDVYLTESGNSAPVIVSFSLSPVLPEVPASGPVTNASSPLGADLILVATLLPGGLMETPSGNLGGPGLQLGEVGPGGLFVLQVEDEGGGEAQVVVDVDGQGDGQPAVISGWESFPLGADEALRERARRQEFYERVEDLLDAFRAFMQQFQGWLAPPADLPGGPIEAGPKETAWPGSTILEVESAPNRSAEEHGPIAAGDPAADWFSEQDLPPITTPPHGQASDSGSGSEFVPAEAGQDRAGFWLEWDDARIPSDEPPAVDMLALWFLAWQGNTAPGPVSVQDRHPPATLPRSRKCGARARLSVVGREPLPFTDN